jgi:hypothetical protein
MSSQDIDLKKLKRKLKYQDKKQEEKIIIAQNKLKQTMDKQIKDITGVTKYNLSKNDIYKTVKWNKPLKIKTKGKTEYIQFPSNKNWNRRGEYNKLVRWFVSKGIKLPKSRTFKELRKARYDHYYSSGSKKYIVTGTAQVEQETGGNKIMKTVKLIINNDNVIKLPDPQPPKNVVDLIIGEKGDSWLRTNTSSEYIISFEYTLHEYKAGHIADHKMKATNLTHRFLNNYNDEEIKQKDGMCVIDWIASELIGRPGYINYTYKSIVDEFNRICDITEGISTNDIIKWCQSKKNISVYALDPFFKKFTSYIAKQHSNLTQLVFMVNNGHCYPINKPETKTQVAKGKGIDISNYMEDFKFKIEHAGDTFEFIDFDNMEDFIKGVLPGELFHVKNNEIDLRDLVGKCIAYHNDISSFFKPNNQYGITAFSHPITGQVVIEAYDFDKRKEVCETLYKVYPNELFKFKNQSFTTIIKNLRRVMVGSFQKSQYNEQVAQVLRKFAPSPLVQTISREYDVMFSDAINGVDICGSYSNYLMRNEDDIPIYNIHRDIEVYNGQEIECGEYYINETNIYGVKLKPTFYSYVLINKLLEKKLLKKDDIKYYIKASKSLDGNIFKELIEYVYNTFDKPEAKQMINSMIGDFGTVSKKTHKFCLTDNMDLIGRLMYEHSKDNIDFTLDQLKGVFLFRTNTQSYLNKTDTSLYRFVISGGILQLIELLEIVHNDKNSKIIGVNTDCVYYAGLSQFHSQPCDNIIDRLGTYRKEETPRPKLYGYNKYDTLNIEEYEKTMGSGFVIEGRAGLGKSHQCIKKIIELEKQNINYVGLAFTNKAVLENNDKYKKMTGIDKKVFVLFDSYFPRAENEETYINKLKNKIILIDEYSMTPNKWMSLIYSSFIKNNNQVFMYGNMDQLPEIADDNAKPINYLNSTAIRQMCPVLEELQWHEHARQDKKTFDILCNFIKTGELSIKLKKTGDYKYNISQLNKTRKIITKKYANSGIEVTFKYQDNEEKYLIDDGTPVFGTNNNPKLNVVNNCMYYVDSISKDNVIIDEKTISLKDFSNNYIPAYCGTTYKYQGATLSENYNIFDAKMMNRNHMYVALSRCTNIDNVHCDYVKDYYEPFVFADECEKIKPIKLKFGNIYCVEFTDNTYYIGETFKTVLDRMYEHLNYKGKFIDTVFEKKDLVDKAYCIATIPVEDKAQLKQYETYYIQHYEKKYGSNNILNKKQKRKKLPEKKTKIEINKANKIEDNRYMKLSREEIAEKRFKITNDIKKMKLRIRYRDSNGKEKEISKKYDFDALDANTNTMETAIEYMKRRRHDLISDLYDL